MGFTIYSEASPTRPISRDEKHGSPRNRFDFLALGDPCLAAQREAKRHKGTGWLGNLKHKERCTPEFKTGLYAQRLWHKNHEMTYADQS